MRTRWRPLFCVAGLVVMVLAGCRKSESRREAAPPPVSEAQLHPPFGFIDIPRENEAVASGSQGAGWALDDSGVANVTVSLDNGPAVAANMGQSSPAIRQAYPRFPGSDTAGFTFEIPSAASGPHVLVATIVGRDGGQTALRRHVQIK